MYAYELSELSAYFDEGLCLDPSSPEDVSAFVAKGVRLVSHGVSETHVWGIIDHFVPLPILA